MNAINQVRPVAQSLHVSKRDTRTSAKSRSRLLDATQKLRVMLESILKPILVRPDSDQDAGRAPVPRDEDLLLDRQAAQDRSVAPTSRRFRFAALFLVPVLVSGVVTTVRAQRGWGRIPEGYGVPIRRMPEGFSDGGLFTICKLRYQSVRSEWLGMGWATDYPFAAINLTTRMSELTKTPVSRDARGEPNYWVVTATDPNLFRCPFVMAADVGTLRFSQVEVARMREYLLKGGFLWVDDFWGSAAWHYWSQEIRRVLPEHKIFDIPPEHPIRHSLYDLKTIPQVTAIQAWRGSGFSTSERGADSPHANFRGIADDKGRIMVLMSHNTDIADSWERESEDREFFLQFSPQGYAVGLNVVIYALSH